MWGHMTAPISNYKEMYHENLKNHIPDYCHTRFILNNQPLCRSGSGGKENQDRHRIQCIFFNLICILKGKAAR